MSINWENSGIPSAPDKADIIEGASESGTEVGSDPACGIGGNSEISFGMGPEGNMFGAQSPVAAGVIDQVYNFSGPDAIVQTRDNFNPVEAVEGFGEPIDVKLIS